MALAKFVHIKLKASFTAELQKTYENAIVFIQDTCEIFTHGTFYGLPVAMQNKINSLETAVNALKYFAKVSDGTNTAAASAKDSTIKFTGAGDVAVTVSTDGVKVDGTTLKNAAANALTKANQGITDAAAAQKAADDHAALKTNPHGVTKAQVGLGNVTNESKATMFTNPAFTGTPTAPTAAEGTNTTQIATTAFVKAAVDKIGNTLAAALRYVGTIGSTGATVTALPAAHNVGDVYIVKTAGTYAGQVCEVGDMIICHTAGAAAKDADWQVIQTNINGAVTAAADLTANQLVVGNGGKTSKALAAGTNGQVLKMVAGVPAWADETTYSCTAGTDGSFTFNGTKISIGKPATAGTADNTKAALSIQLNGGTATAFDGSTAKSINITPAGIGAAAASHNQASNTITACTGYAKASAYSAPAAADSLNTVLGKLAAGVEELTWVEL